jgi:hypothetical protein
MPCGSLYSLLPNVGAGRGRGRGGRGNKTDSAGALLCYSDAEMVTDSDKVVAGFAAGCVENPDRCTLAKNRTATELEEALYDFFDHLKYNPMPFLGMVLDYTTVKGVLTSILYRPAQWPVLAQVLDGLMAGDASAVLPLLELLGAAPPSAASPTLFEANSGIKCGDKTLRLGTLAETRPYIEEIFAKSRIFGDVPANVVARCAQWPMQAKERYTGNFQVKTAHPMLLIGNSFDPVTPLVSAKNMSSGFEGSVVLQHDGYGVRCPTLSGPV